MEIEIHGFVVVVHNISAEEIIKLTNHVLHIDYRLYAKNEIENKLFLQYSIGNKGESVSIRSGSLKDNGLYGYIRITLHGSFFDNSPKFIFEELMSFISQYKYTTKQLDVAFNDTDKCLSIEEIVRWCNYPDDYCAGSLVRKHAPKVLYERNKFCRVQLDLATSKTNYGTIYIRPDSGFIRFEIKFKKAEKILHLLEFCSIHSYQQFQSRSLEALVGCISFIIPSSRGKRGKAKDIKQPNWKSFLQSDINKINWNRLKKEQEDNRFYADNYKRNRSIKRVASMLQNLVKKASIVMIPEAEVLNKFSEYSGYIVSRNNAG